MELQKYTENLKLNLGGKVYYKNKQSVFGGIITSAVLLVLIVAGAVVIGAGVSVYGVFVKGWGQSRSNDGSHAEYSDFNTAQYYKISEVNNTNHKIDLIQTLSNQLKPDQPAPGYTKTKTETCDENSISTKGINNTPVTLAPGETLEQKTNLFTNECYSGKCGLTNDTLLPNYAQKVKGLDAHILLFGTETKDSGVVPAAAPLAQLLSLHGEPILVKMAYNSSKTNPEQLFQLQPSGSYILKTSSQGYCSARYNDCIGLSSNIINDGHGNYFNTDLKIIFNEAGVIPIHIATVKYSNTDISDTFTLDVGQAIIRGARQNNAGIYAFALLQQPDGNLVEYVLTDASMSHGYALWGDGLSGAAANDFTTFDRNSGLFVVRHQGGNFARKEIYAGGIFGPYKLALQSDGNLVIYDRFGQAVWSNAQACI